ncbi:hypothetical protein B0H17DRAFT_1123920 [Mycena rosella]|uniref:Uncharacterized protein n=1 Tax=Mycena rosella TaxID=1033263 RepID=A0AAD7MCM0_MYCRO|nr:hypothetical protein B0H17DRAFT_1123920 [Mycena rosella]
MQNEEQPEYGRRRKGRGNVQEERCEGKEERPERTAVVTAARTCGKANITSVTSSSAKAAKEKVRTARSPRVASISQAVGMRERRERWVKSGNALETGGSREKVVEVDEQEFARPLHRNEAGGCESGVDGGSVPQEKAFMQGRTSRWRERRTGASRADTRFMMMVEEFSCFEDSLKSTQLSIKVCNIGRILSQKPEGLLDRAKCK